MHSDPSAPQFQGRTLLVTGAAGFIGLHVCLRLLGAGARVIGVDNLTGHYDPALKAARLRLLHERPGFRFEELDVANHEGFAQLMREARPEAVIHLAAQAGVRQSIDAPRDYLHANLDGFLSVLEAARATPPRHLIYASSSSVYGANAKVPFAETDPVDNPISFYAASKRANELMAHTWAHLHGLKLTGLRFFTVYGPWGRPDMAYFKFTKAILEGQPIDVFNHGDLRRDFTYVDDIVEAIVRLVDRVPDRHTIFNMGNHTPVRLDDFIAMLERVIGKTAQKRMLPMQPGDVPMTYADVSALTAAVGFAPSTPLEAGLSEFVAWYRAHYNV